MFTKILIILALSFGSFGIYGETNESFFLEQQTKLGSSDPNEVRDAIDKLTFVRSNRGVRDIISALKGMPEFPDAPQNSPVIKFYAAKALGKKGDSIAILPLKGTFQKNCGNITERKIAKRKITDPVSDSKSTTIPYFYAEGEHNIVIACGEILRSLGELPLTDVSTEELKKALLSPNFYIRSSAADGLFFSGKKDFLGVLRESLGKEQDPYAYISILSAVVGLERLPNQNFREVLKKLNEGDPEIRKKASEALVRLDLSISTPYLKKAIEIENDPHVRRQLESDYRTLTAFHPPQ